MGGFDGRSPTANSAYTAARQVLMPALPKGSASAAAPNTASEQTSSRVRPTLSDSADPAIEPRIMPAIDLAKIVPARPLHCEARHFPGGNETQAGWVEAVPNSDRRCRRDPPSSNAASYQFCDPVGHASRGPIAPERASEREVVISQKCRLGVENAVLACCSAWVPTAHESVVFIACRIRSCLTSESAPRRTLLILRHRQLLSAFCLPYRDAARNKNTFGGN